MQTAHVGQGREGENDIELDQVGVMNKDSPRKNTEALDPNFDVIRLSTYRTACKLRFVQKRCNLHLVDVWNMIEAFRDNGLNTLDHNAEINVSRLETILSSIYQQLNKRLPTTHQINLTVFSMKAMLATMCGGKIVDKLRYIFSQISDSNGAMIFPKFDQFLREVLKLPTAVFEGPSFGYTDHSVRTCFPQQKKILLNTFLDILMADPPPQCLVWLPLMHRLANQCHGYQLCQSCFWRGHANGPHSNQHQMKEHSSWKSPAKKLSHAISKSLGCVPIGEPPHPLFPEQAEQRPQDTTHNVGGGGGGGGGGGRWRREVVKEVEEVAVVVEVAVVEVVVVVVLGMLSMVVV
ncbi:hypothetical protein CRUP_011787, partial [Coryphaenoides rupestris]